MLLVIEDEAGTRSVVPFTGEAIVVGRGSEGVTFRLAERNVSRRHARFVRQSGNVFVEDLGSRIGTRVNGERISGRRRLRDGDLVQIGDYDLVVVTEAGTLTPDAPPPLPAAARPAEGAVTSRLPAVTPAEAAAAAPSNARRVRAVRLLVAAGLVALALAIAVALAAGAFTAPAALPITRP